jgi:hypothetical protein
MIFHVTYGHNNIIWKFRAVIYDHIFFRLEFLFFPNFLRKGCLLTHPKKLYPTQDRIFGPRGPVPSVEEKQILRGLYCIERYGLRSAQKIFWAEMSHLVEF